MEELAYLLVSVSATMDKRRYCDKKLESQWKLGELQFSRLRKCLESTC